MFFSSLDIKNKLIQERIRQHKLMDDVYEILDQATEEDIYIEHRLKTACPGEPLSVRLNRRDKLNVFDLQEIQKVCIRYRLRFLDSSYFKNEFPYEAISRIKDFERKYLVTVEKFKVMAPENAFNLENINKDPLLFTQLADGSYYFIHKWGHDLAWYKKFLYLPLQTPLIFFLSLLVACAAISFSVPTAWMNILNFTSEIYLKIWLSFHLFIMFTGFAIWSGMAFDKNFSCYIWDSKYYNY